MQAYYYKDNQLHAQNIAIEDITKTIPTPFYCYNANNIIKQYQYYQKAFSNYKNFLLAYAIKANSNLAIIKLLAKEGSGADIVSQGELKRALKAGIPAEKIVYSGVGKTSEELEASLQAGIGCFNVESLPELVNLDNIAKKMNKKADIAIRVNPNIDPKTHPKISTGLKDSKFGIDIKDAVAAYKMAQSLQNINICGVDVHIGSQITDLSCFEQCFSIMAKFIKELKEHDITIKHIDLGGGLGINYGLNASDEEAEQHINDYAKLVLKYFADSGLKIICEPGRSIVGNSGILVSQVIYSKYNNKKHFFIVDAAMNDLIRPTLYNAKQQIITLQKMERDIIKADIVGPVCESGDYLEKAYEMPRLESGDKIAVLGCGAYGAVMAGTYNSRLLIPEVLIKDDKFAVIRPRQSYDDMLKLDHIPDWI